MLRYALLLILTIFLSSIQAQQPTVGTVFYDNNATEGYTLLTPNSRMQSYLIDNCGRVVNSWTSNYFPGLSSYFHTDSKLYRSARISNPFIPVAATSGRVERFNWQGVREWYFEYTDTNYTAHHDFVVLPNGNVILIVAEQLSDSIAFAAGRDPQLLNSNNFWLERLVEVRPILPDSGEIVWEWNVMDHLIQNFDSTKANYGDVAAHTELVDINFTPNNINQDWLHANSIDYNATQDQLVLSIRDLDEIWVIDHSTTTQEAAGHTGGNSGKGGDLLYRWGNPQAYRAGSANDQVYFGQHDVQWVADSMIIVYNNARSRGFSSVELIDPLLQSNGSYPSLALGQAYPPATPNWTYNLDSSLSSDRLSGASRLANGHTFICSGNLGYFREIDQQDSLVWEYINPAGGIGIATQGQPALGGNQVFLARKYLASDPRFTNLDMSPGDPIEQNFSQSYCNVFSSTKHVEDANTPNFQLFPNPSLAQASIHLQGTTPIEQIELYDLMGRLALERNYEDPQLLQSIQLPILAPGIYVLRVNHQFNVQLAIH